MIWIYILLFVIIALIMYLIYLVRFWGKANAEITDATYISLKKSICKYDKTKLIHLILKNPNANPEYIDYYMENIERILKSMEVESEC